MSANAKVEMLKEILNYGFAYILHSKRRKAAAKELLSESTMFHLKDINGYPALIHDRTIYMCRTDWMLSESILDE